MSLKSSLGQDITYSGKIFQIQFVIVNDNPIQNENSFASVHCFVLISHISHINILLAEGIMT